MYEIQVLLSYGFQLGSANSEKMGKRIPLDSSMRTHLGLAVSVDRISLFLSVWLLRESLLLDSRNISLSLQEWQY